MIRLPSIQQITSNASATIRRFPFVLIFAILGTMAVIWLVDLPWDQRDGYDWLRNFSWVSALSISFLLAINITSESRNWNSVKRYIASGAAVLLLGVYYLFLPEDFEPSNSEAFYRYSLLFLSSHLLVSIAPYLGEKSVQDFWAYNKTLFLRILLSALYVSVLYIGLAIAMYSLEVLLEFDIEGKRYGQLAIFLIGIFGTWFFLSGVPHPNQLTDEEKAYPKGLKIFVQHVLIPLIVIYILILYLYTGKIIIEWQWPTGWVAHLVLNFSIAGILALLLLYPIQDENGHKWVRLFSKGYYIALIPLIILLMLSIWVRISEYGVTVNRYYVATLAVWLTGVVIYFLISRAKDIRVIPVSLFLIMILISFGPLSAFEVSEKSQLNRLEENLSKYELLTESGTIIKTDREIPFYDRKQISSGITYLLDLKGPKVLQPYFEQDLNELIAEPDTINYASDAERITELVGIDYVYDWETEETFGEGYTTIQVQKKSMHPVPLEDYEYYIGEIPLWFSSTPFDITVDSNEYTISLQTDEPDLLITEKASGKTLRFQLSPFFDELPETGTNRSEPLPVEQLTLTQETDGIKAKIVFQSLMVQKKDGEMYALSMTFSLFLSISE